MSVSVSVPFMSAPFTGVLGAPGEAQDVGVGALVRGTPTLEDLAGLLAVAELDLVGRLLLAVPTISTVPAVSFSIPFFFSVR